ncbi:TPA: hypothetical protein ENS27_06910 [bacterium]|jgi:predicted DNA-binding protein|nr:hypothetical protein [bacterium]
MKPASEKVSETKTIRITMPNDMAQKLEQVSMKLGISETVLIKNITARYLGLSLGSNLVEESEQKFDFDPIGFGMWADREDMEDSVTWVQKIREQEWNCS